MANDTMLVISAHAADWCTRAGGTILKYAAAGWKVEVWCLTCGEHGESRSYWVENPGGSVAECNRLRHQEAAAAADFMGASIRFLDYRDYPLHMDGERLERLISDLLDLRPRLVLTHWNMDPFNVDHALRVCEIIKVATMSENRYTLWDDYAL